jgi:hypothetical protein
VTSLDRPWLANVLTVEDGAAPLDIVGSAGAITEIETTITHAHVHC